MIDDRLRSAYDTYSRLAKEEADAQVVVGRRPAMETSEQSIFDDVLAKVRLQRNDRVACIGVGAGGIAARWLDLARTMELTLCFVDFPDVIERIRTRLLPGAGPAPAVTLIEGVFPFACAGLAPATYDVVELYSVIHYSDQPLAIVDAAVALLAPAGRLLIGDIPNLDRKGRFLCSETGRRFEAAFRNVPVDAVPRYASPDAFANEARAAGAAPLDDAFVVHVLQTYRSRGYEAFVTDQPPTLPYFHTREDIVIRAPYA